MNRLRRLAAALCALPAVVTVLSLSRSTHWIFRLWDFPRMQIASVASAGLALQKLKAKKPSSWERLLSVLAGATILWQAYRIHVYTPLVRPTVKRVREEEDSPDDRIVLMISNVLMDNRRYDRFLDAVKSADPDVLLAVEIDDAWMEAIEPLAERYAHVVRRPLDNFYGMALFSRLELVDPKIEFLVQEDIPSVHTRIRLRSGVEVMLHGLHPRPPEPIRDEPSSPRDAELVLMGRAIAEENDTPTIVAGDLNDVAWSPTSELFVRLSGLLDPRAGRGFFNSYNAKNPLFRYPLDHVFHSKHFKLVRLQRLNAIGSDHFPILIELQYVPEAAEEQEESQERPGDQKRADELLEQEKKDAATGFDRPRGE
jgi:endonuclease/exonuclease/phosphatase (EEP) superfamily protein YafD